MAGAVRVRSSRIVYLIVLVLILGGYHYYLGYDDGGTQRQVFKNQEDFDEALGIENRLSYPPRPVPHNPSQSHPPSLPHPPIRPSRPDANPPPPPQEDDIEQAIVAIKWPPVPPPLTVIAIWHSVSTRYPYLPHHFASIRANPSIDFLFIKWDKFGVGCINSLAEGNGAGKVPNLREVCYSKEEYWGLHADWLCAEGRWACSSAQYDKVLDTLVERGDGDVVNSYFRPFRASIFSYHLHPKLTHWAWCDQDVIFGSLARTLPWDLFNQFDLLIASAHFTGPEHLLYFRGHLSIFKRSERIVEEFRKIANLRSVKNYLELPWISSAAEESEYSHHALTATALTFVVFPAMVDSRYHLSAISSSPLTGSGEVGEREQEAGVFTCHDEWYWNETTYVTQPENGRARKALSASIASHVSSLAPHSHLSSSSTPITLDELAEIQTFTPAAIKEEYEVEVEVGKWPWGLWFPLKYAVSVTTDTVPGRGEMRYGKQVRYLLRREPYGPVMDHVEPLKSWQVLKTPPEAFLEAEDDLADANKDTEEGRRVRERMGREFPWVEMTYNHFQGEKYKWWWNMPQRPLGGFPTPPSPHVRGAAVEENHGREDVEGGERDLEMDVILVDREEGLVVWDEWGYIWFDTAVEGAWRRD